MDEEGRRRTLVALLEGLDRERERVRSLIEDLDGDVRVVAVPRQGEWTFGQVEDLWQQVRHLEGVRAMFELTAQRPGQVVTFAELTHRSGLDDLEQRNQHARMSRVAAKLFDGKRWPIENWQGSYVEELGRAEMRYRMDPRIAAWWRQADTAPPDLRVRTSSGTNGGPPYTNKVVADGCTVTLFDDGRVRLTMKPPPGWTVVPKLKDARFPGAAMLEMRRA